MKSIRSTEDIAQHIEPGIHFDYGDKPTDFALNAAATRLRELAAEVDRLAGLLAKWGGRAEKAEAENARLRNQVSYWQQVADEAGAQVRSE